MKEEHAACPYFLRSLIRLYATVQRLHTPPIVAVEDVTIDQYAIHGPESVDWVFANLD
ncbi:MULTISPECIES: hypothetical protein [Burkholderia]|uniref:hypothetical protein n=1 Tax=Burkholderia TaxID=32008 RepID=UPI000398A14A|nr:MULTISPECIES: hypothetical protein [Burkholderia]ERJ41272.1 hypothetical protein L810_8395 [Burkholderia sp. AU4i]MDN7442449.1 hypothetical protein [Burkholderia cepacia]